MGCYHPVDIMVNPKPTTPQAIRVAYPQTVPCGNCIGCRGDQARDWAIRIMHETEMHRHSWFTTLTYDNEQIPEHGSLHPADLRQFFKTLRRDRPKGSVSYFACGEYGETTQRPHYHAVLFGPHFLDRDILRHSNGSPIWRSPDLESHWDLGLSEFGTVTPASAAYVAGYVNKKLHKKAHPDAYLRVDPDTGEIVEIQKEFARMSLKPAIGNRWIRKWWRDVYPRDFVVVDGKQFRPPRYYDKWMGQIHEKEDHDCDEHRRIMIDVRMKRMEEKNIPDDYTLEAREKIHRARQALYQQRNAI